MWVPKLPFANFKLVLFCGKHLQEDDYILAFWFFLKLRFEANPSLDPPLLIGIQKKGESCFLPK